MTAPQIGDAVADLSLPATGDQTLSLHQFHGKNLVLYFYPKDSTPGCTKEGQAFRDFYAQFTALNTEILGVSRDGVKAHENFKSKQAFPFDLLSDKEEALCNLFDVIKMKNMYGKQVRGIERSTFLIDSDGVLRQEWRKVKVAGHVEAVLQAVQEINNA